MNESNIFKICLLSDGKKGHLIKSEGIIHALSLLIKTEVCIYKVSWKIGFMRKALLSFKIFRKLLPKEICLKDFKEEQYDLIISSGGATEWINAKIAKQISRPNLFIGTLRHCEKKDFSFLAISKYKDYSGYIHMPIVPNTITEDKIKVFADKYYPENNQKIMSILIGGNGSGIKWNRTDFEIIIKNFLLLANSNNVKLIFLTSRRTPNFIEEIIDDYWEHPSILKSSKRICCSDLKNDRDYYYATLGVADYIFVSEDSASMISEALSSRKKVFTFLPPNFSGINHNEDLLMKYSAENYIIRTSSLKDLNLDMNYNWEILSRDWQKQLGENLYNRLKDLNN